MELTPVHSSNIDAIGYDRETHTLSVQFLSGKTYTYANVPEELYRAFLAAPSKGQYFARMIRPAYTGVQV